MAAAKPEVLIFQLVYKRATQFQRPTPYFWVQEFNGVISNTARCNLESEIQDGGIKPEVLIYQLLDKIATPFQWLPHVFRLNLAVISFHSRDIEIRRKLPEICL